MGVCTVVSILIIPAGVANFSKTVVVVRDKSLDCRYPYSSGFDDCMTRGSSISGSAPISLTKPVVLGAAGYCCGADTCSTRGLPTPGPTSVDLAGPLFLEAVGSSSCEQSARSRCLTKHAGYTYLGHDETALIDLLSAHAGRLGFHFDPSLTIPFHSCTLGRIPRT